jgi:sporulation protein YlmC with PRC-barrel domain
METEMKKVLLCSIAASAFFAHSAVAQNTPAAAANDDACTQLVRWVHSNPGNDVGISAEQLKVLDARNDQKRCAQLLAGIENPQRQAGQQGDQDGQVVVRQAAPSVQIDQAEPRVTVRQAQPSVAVTQPQPEITVRQPAPQVTVFIPKPEIVIRMPDPSVRVSQAQPEVEVTQPEPTVQVVQPEQQARVTMAQGDQPEVQVIQPEQQAKVDVRKSGEPNVNYEAEEPQVRVQREEGQPAVRYEQAESGEASAPDRQLQADADSPAERTEQAFAAADRNPAEVTGAVGESDTRTVRVSDIDGMDVVNARGNQLGDIDRLVVSRADNRIMAIVAHGGFLGLGEKKVAIPLENMAMSDDRLVVQGLTDDDIKAMPEWNEGSPNFRELADNQRAEVPTGEQ